MRLFALAAAVSCVLVAQPAVPAKPVAPLEVTDWSFAHPDATLVGSIRPNVILESPILAAILTEGTKNPEVPQGPEVAAMMGMAKAILGGIAEVRFSVQDNGTPEPDVIAVVRGTLDESLVGMLAQDKAKTRRINGDTLLLGNGVALDQAAARMAKKGVSLQPRALQGTETLLTSDFWLAGQLPDTPMTASLKDKLRGLALGLSVRDNLEIELNMTAANEAMAQDLVREALASMDKQPEQFRGMLQSYAQGSTARFRVAVPREQVLEAIRSGSVPGMTGLPGMVAGNTERPTPLAPPVLVDPNAPPKRRTIVIQGLDDGPREIPLDPAAK